MGKHTPGPWVHVTQFGWVGAVATEDGQVIAQAQQLTASSDDWKQRNSNARLIAAAPELLALLQEIRPLLAAHQMLITDRVDAAITKATGEEA